MTIMSYDNGMHVDVIGDVIVMTLNRSFLAIKYDINCVRVKLPFICDKRNVVF